MNTLNHQMFTSTEKLPKKMLPQEHYGEKCMAHFTGRLTGLRQAVLTVGKERHAAQATEPASSRILSKFEWCQHSTS